LGVGLTVAFVVWELRARAPMLPMRLFRSRRFSAGNAVLTSVAPQDIGRASGTFSTLRQFGGAFGLAVLVAVFAGAGSYASPQAFNDGFAPAIAACGVLALAAALAGIAMPARRTTTAVATTQPTASPAFEIRRSVSVATDDSTRDSDKPEHVSRARDQQSQGGIR
jgi:hypothetical protein